MDSGNSGSLQSNSSGGDEDYESSRGGAAPDSFSAFFNHQSYPPAGHVSTTIGSFNAPPPPPPPSFFDPLASYFDHLSRSTNPNPVLNPNPVWPKDNTTTTSLPASLDNSQPSSSSAGADRHQSQNLSGGGARNPRKRTRASRRAPTTVLTTDTTNFRAMVQEFTGIPSPPGAASSSSLFFPRPRLDLFSSGRGGMEPPYLLRPLAQKIPIPQPPPPSFLSITTTNKNTTDVMTASSSYRMPGSNLGLLPPNLSFKYPSGNPDPGCPKPGSSGSLELPLTTAARDDQRDHHLTASFLTAPDAVNGGLGLGVDAAAGAPAPSTSSSRNGLNNNAHHSHQPPQNLGFAHQQIG